MTSLTKDQIKFLTLLVNNDKVSVKSGHGVGKTCGAAIAVLWFLYTHIPSIVLTTAPTERQVKNLLWREIRTRKRKAIMELAGKPLIMQLDLETDHYALGFSTNDVQQLSGFHSPNIMVVIDEANGFPEDLFEPLDGVLSGGDRAVLFMIGNPLDPSGRFFSSFSDGVTKTVTISCLDHPNIIEGRNVIPGAVTQKWVDEMEVLWGNDSPFWDARVKGVFPRISTDTIISLAWAETAEQQTFKTHLDKRRYMGVDVGEFGGDPSVWFIGTKRGIINIHKKTNLEITESTGITKKLMDDYGVKPEDTTVDAIGLGAGLVSRLLEQNIRVNRFKGSERAVDSKTFADKNAEAWWVIRGMMNPNCPDYLGFSFNGRRDELKSEICTRKFTLGSDGRIKLEDKRAYRKRMRKSPNFGDGFSYAYYKLCAKMSYGGRTLPNVMLTDS